MKYLIFGTALMLAGCGSSDPGVEAPAQASMEAPTEAVATLAGDHLWDVDEAASSITFGGVKEGEAFEGTFGEFDVEVNLDPDAPQDGGAIRARIFPASAVTGDAERDEALPNGDWFDVKSHPVATFASDDITATDAGYVARGTLTIKGSSTPLDLPFTLDVEGEGAVARTQTVTLDRSDFGVGSGAFDTDQWISFDVPVRAEIVATRR